MGAERHQLSSRQHHFHAEDRIPGGAVLDGPNTACIVPDFSSDGGDPARCGCGRIKYPVRFERQVEIIIHDSRFHPAVDIRHVDFKDPVHPFHVHYNAPLCGNGLAAHTGAAAPGDHGNKIPVCVPDDFLYLFRSVRADHNPRKGAVHGGIRAVYVKIRRVGFDIVISDNTFESGFIDPFHFFSFHFFHASLFHIE